MPARGGNNCGGVAWWTRARVLEGLRRLHRETGEAPTARRRYQALVGPVDRGRVGALRRYPSACSVSRHFEGFAQAWKAAGISASSPTGVTLVEGVEGLGRAKLRQPGERFGRLVVVRLSGYRERAGARWALWLCRCDCGGERLVESGRIHQKRECEACGRARKLGNLKPFASGERPIPAAAA